MPAKSAPVKCNPKIAALRNAAFFVLGATAMLVTGCAQKRSPVYNEKEYDPTATGPAFSESFEKTDESTKDQETRVPLDDEIYARNNYCEGCVYPRTARNKDKSVYTKHEQEYIEGFYFYDNDRRLWVSFFEDRVPLAQKENGKRRKQPVGVDHADKVSSVLREYWEKKEMLQNEERVKIGNKIMRTKVLDKVRSTVNQITEGEKELMRLGIKIPSRIKDSKNEATP